MRQSNFSPRSAVSAGSFVDGQFVASPEGQLLLDYLNNKFGIPVEVQKGSTEAGGYFNFLGGKGGYGGGLDKNRRVVFLNDSSPDVHVLAHEATHAFDPSLQKLHENENILSKGQSAIAGFTYGNEVDPRRAPEFLNAFMHTSPAHTRLTSEALAQKGANESLEAIGLPNPGLQDSWYRNYPNEHVEASIDQAYALMANPYTPSTSARDQYIRQTFDTPTMYSAPNAPSARNLSDSTQWDMRDAVTKRYLELGLNPELIEATQKVRSRAEAYLDRMLPEAKKSNNIF